MVKKETEQRSRVANFMDGFKKNVVAELDDKVTGLGKSVREQQFPSSCGSTFLETMEKRASVRGRLREARGIPLTELPQATDIPGLNLDERATWTETYAKLVLAQAKVKDIATELLKLLEKE